MTLFVLMLSYKRTHRYQLMALIFGFAIILFTYIPGISAKSIGLRCQKERLTQLINDLKLIDAKTGKLNDNIDKRSIRRDSLMCEQYKDATSVISYVRKEMGEKEFEARYGTWTHSEYSFDYSDDDNLLSTDNLYARRKPVEVGEYTIMLPPKTYQCEYNDNVVIIRQGDDIVLRYPIQEIVRQDTTLLSNPERLLTYSNDSLMLVLEGVCINDSVVTDVKYHGFHLFKKKGR